MKTLLGSIRIALGIILMCGSTLPLFAQSSFTEDFETGMPTSAPTSETNYTLKSGVWTFYKATSTGTKHAGVYGVTLANNTTAPGYIISPALNTVGKITFWSRAGGSGKTLTVQKSVNGAAFVTIATPSITSAYAEYSIDVNETGNNVRLKFMNTPGSGTTMYMDDLTVTSMSRTVVTVSATSLPNFGVLVIGSHSASSSYTVSGTVLPSEIVVKAPPHFKVSADDVSFADSVQFAPIDSAITAKSVFVRFEPTAAVGAYQANVSNNNSAAMSKTVAVSGTAIDTEATVQSNVSFSGITGTSMTVNMTGGNGTHRLVVMKAGAAVDWTPTDGRTHTGVNAAFPSATDQTGGNRIVYNGPGSSVIVTGLSVFSEYHVAVYEYNGDVTASQNYLTSNPSRGQATTEKVPGLTLLPGTLAFGTVLIDSLSTEKTYALSGMYLTPVDNTITVTAPAGFEVSLTTGSGFASSISVPYTGGSLPLTNILVRFHPSAKSYYAGAISNSGGGATTVNVSVSGMGSDGTTEPTKHLYLSPTGNDVTGSGSIDQPFFSLQKAVDLAAPGDTIFMRDGVYNYLTRININKSGLPDARICIFSMPGERAILDFSGMVDNDYNQGIRLTGSYWHFYGFDVKGAGDNGLLVERDKPSGGSYADIKDKNDEAHDNIIEFCRFYENRDSGIQLKNLASNNRVINCDSYYNRDSADGDADGFSPKLTVGTGNYFYGCRAWQNSDDGWDLYLKAKEDGFPQDMVTTMENCWCFQNGYLKSGSASSGNGNGFKLGGSSGKDQRHDAVLIRCLSFENLQKGFDQNGNAGNMTLINTTGFARPLLSNSSHYTYRIDGTTLAAGKQLIHTNCVAVCDGVERKTSKWAEFEMIGGTQTTCQYRAEELDFTSIDSAGVRGPRKPDGSLPDLAFMHIKAGNTRLIDMGTKVPGLAYNGLAPDLGAFETQGVTDVTVQPPFEAMPTTVALIGNYPNPFNPSTLITYQIPEYGWVSLRVFDMIGRQVNIVEEGIRQAGVHSVRWDATGCASGTYLVMLESGMHRSMIKVTLIK